MIAAKLDPAIGETARAVMDGNRGFQEQKCKAEVKTRNRKASSNWSGCVSEAGGFNTFARLSIGQSAFSP